MAGTRILIVEDSPTQLKVTTAALQGHGYELLVAVNGEEALTKIFAEKPDLVILDVVMPKMDGFQVCRKIKSSPEVKNIPVIMLTTKGNKTDKFWAKKQGAEMYLTKPCDPLELLDFVRKSLS